MKAIVTIMNGESKIILTPETEFEKTIIDDMVNEPQEWQCKPTHESERYGDGYNKQKIELRSFKVQQPKKRI